MTNKVFLQRFLVALTFLALPSSLVSGPSAHARSDSEEDYEAQQDYQDLVYGANKLHSQLNQANQTFNDVLGDSRQANVPVRDARAGLKESWQALGQAIRAARAPARAD